MRRLAGLAATWLVVAGPNPLAAQRADARPIVRLETPRPAPFLPAVLVPFSIPDTWCEGGGGLPRVTVRVYDVLGGPLRTLRTRGRSGQELSALPLRCGRHVAYWDGSVGSPPRLPPATTYYIRLLVQRGDRRDATTSVQLVVPQY